MINIVYVLTLLLQENVVWFSVLPNKTIRAYHDVKGSRYTEIEELAVIGLCKDYVEHHELILDEINMEISGTTCKVDYHTEKMLDSLRLIWMFSQTRMVK